jgi:uncharacterized protein (DUF488 family)
MLREVHRQIFTVGHSDNSIEWFIELLRMHGITALADVRSSPYSRFNHQFNRDQLKAALNAARIHYVPLSDELGARRKEPECYVDGKARYDLIANLPLFQKGLRRVQHGAERHRIALMCAEKDPITCHRTILVCRHLKPYGIPISHILQNGELETTEGVEQRLLEVAGNGGVDLFASDPCAALAHAYDVQGDRIAYTRSTVPSEERS